MKVTIAVIILSSLGIAPSISSSTASNVFESVPQEKREILRASFEQMVTAQTEEDWSRQVLWLSPLYVQDEGSAAYIARMRTASAQPGHLRLVRFDPTDIGPASVAHGYSISGCGIYRKGESEYACRSSVEAYDDGGEWRFTPVLPIGSLGPDPRPCERASGDAVQPN